MPSPATLVTVSQFKDQLRVTHSESDFELESTLADAEDIIVTVMGDRFDVAWTTVTIPGAVRAAILRQGAHLWRFRGDDTDRPEDDGSGLAPGVRWLLQANGYLDLTIG